MDTVRVLRVIEYIGPRDIIEEHLRLVVRDKLVRNRDGREYTIKAATLGEFPEILKREDNEPT